MSSIADVIKKSIFGSVLSETVFYKDREIKAIVCIGTPVVRKNFFRGITVNDVVSDEASFTLLEEDAQEIKTGDQIIHKGGTWYVNKQIAQDTIGKTVTFGASKNTKGFARGFEK